MALGSFGHLVTRFIDFITAKPLDGAERTIVESWLTEAEQAVFFAQDPRDQAHGFESALHVIASLQIDDARKAEFDLIRAALLHDVGKRHAQLGVIARSVASVLIKLGVPLPRRMAMYRDHGRLGARDLEALGVDELISSFALHHHGDRPRVIPVETWDMLQDADRPRKPSLRSDHR